MLEHKTELDRERFLGDKHTEVRQPVFLLKQKESHHAYAMKTFSFFALIIIQTSLLSVYKIANSQTYGRGYFFSPNAVIAASEFTKATLSFFIFCGTYGVRNIFTDINKNTALKFAIIAGFYCVNNYLTFIILTDLDPGTVTLFKAFTPCLTAFLLWLIYDEKLNYLQVYIMATMSCCLIVVKANICSNSERTNQTRATILLCGSVFLTTLSSIFNAKLVKGCTLPLPKQNILLYGFGFVFNIIFYFAFNVPSSGEYRKSFFAGFSNPLTISIIVLNTGIGFAITFIYKYADAILKCIAGVVSAAILVLVSATFFHFELNSHIISGVFLILLSTVFYLRIASQTEAYPVPILKNTKRKLSLSGFCILCLLLLVLKMT